MKKQWNVLVCLVLALALLIPAALAEEIPDLKDDFYEAVNAE
ncbi:MAG: hypothetical protein UFE80_02325 [Christensenellales bacterium]|nr:hypothetical protein [Christensenellales bacterium]